ncbi:MAG: DUF3494 domain-containing protein, partial [Moraxellaceae bacterium]|nr:DUF3494 domain-containing protein [Pseudobdellovibrionaceae bacterium]
MKKNQSVSQCLRLALLLPAFFILSCSGSSTANKNPRNPYGAGPAPVSLSPNGSVVDPADLGAAGNYVILAKTGISNVPGSALTGNIGVSPAASSYITGFPLTEDATNVFSTSNSITGKVYAATYAAPTPTNLTSAIGNMETAYTTAAGRSPPD